jgi:hypothetical protein
MEITRAIKVNASKRVIEITKKFEKAASYFGTDEYKALQEVKRDYPKYRVVVKKSSKRDKGSYKGLTYAYMEEYIKSHDDAKGTVMNAFMDLRALSDAAMEVNAEPCSYGEIKKWFLGTYPEIENFASRRNGIVEYTKLETAYIA